MNVHTVIIFSADGVKPTEIYYRLMVKYGEVCISECQV